MAERFFRDRGDSDAADHDDGVVVGAGTFDDAHLRSEYDPKLGRRGESGNFAAAMLFPESGELDVGGVALGPDESFAGILEGFDELFPNGEFPDGASPLAPISFAAHNQVQRALDPHRIPIDTTRSARIDQAIEDNLLPGAEYLIDPTAILRAWGVDLHSDLMRADTIEARDTASRVAAQLLTSSPEIDPVVVRRALSVLHTEKHLHFVTEIQEGACDNVEGRGV